MEPIKRTKIVKRILISIMTLILIVSCILAMKQIKDRNSISANQELLRAMTYEQFEDGDEKVEGTDNVEFSTFFLRDIDNDGYADKLKGTCREIGQRDTLYMEIKVLTAGRFKDGKIQINGKNFNLAMALPRDQQIKKNAIGSNITEIEFNDLLNGTQKLMAGIISFSSINNNINNYSINDNKIILTGTYVNENGEEIDIRKEVDLQTDWYGTTRTILDTEYKYQDYYNMGNLVNESNNTIDLTFSVKTKELDKKLAIAKNHIEISIPEFNGYKASNVLVTSSNTKYYYDIENNKLIIDREATVDETGNITKSVSRDNVYQIKVQYPLEAYNEMLNEAVELLFPIEVYYDGFNNYNNEFVNPYRSNIVNDIVKAVYYKEIEYTPGTNISDSLSVTIGEYISSPYNNYVISKSKPMRIYNGLSTEEYNDEYNVRWYYYRGNIGENEKIILKENSADSLKKVDNFLNSVGTYTSMEEITTNRGIYFSDLSGVLEENGEIKVYDDVTGNLLITINKDNLNKYSSMYYYDKPIKHIRVEITGMKQQRSIYVYHIKELDDEYITNNYTIEEFNNLKQIRTNLTATKGNVLQREVSRNALYELPTSVAKIEISKNVISTQETEKNDLIKIKAEYDRSNNEIGWTNGTFLVKIPDEILETEINEVNINNSNVVITLYEYFENEQGKFIRIYTENNNPQSYEITIDCDLTPDPRIPTINRNIELYASNEEGTDYYYKGQDQYDVNTNLNTVEMINKTTCGLSIVAPNSLLTNQTLSEFDEEGTIVISPNVADVSPVFAGVDNDERTIKIGVQLKNNYSNDISEIVILGKIPFEGNTSVLTGHDLGSSFTTRMLNTGIEVPLGLQGQVDIYYSTNENPTKDLTDENNNWKKAEDIEDWTQVRTYIIDFKDAILSPSDEYIFYYTVAIPNGLNYNVASYSQHGIWFSLETAEGKYRTQTEPTKTGIIIADKYGLELTKYQTGKNKKINNATYRIAEVKDNNEYGKIRTGVTFNEGKLSITGLLIEQEYEIKEIKSPYEYELNENPIHFICHINAEGLITVEKISGTTRGEFTVIRDNDDNQLVTLSVEDEAKTSLKIIKTEKNTENRISGVNYKITGNGLTEEGKVVRTNTDGEAIIRGLNIGTLYTLEETKAEGYYLNEPISFTISNNNGIYEININGEYKETNITLNDEIPTIELQLEDDKIPTYNLQINKIEKGSITEQNPNGTPVVGAKFDLYKGNVKEDTYTTDENGHIMIENLYQYEEERDIDQNYKLVEVFVPEGYAKTVDVNFYAKTVAEEINGSTTTKLVLEQILEENQEARNYTVDNNTIILTVEDSPSFRLTKKDGETNELLPNTKFAIFNVEEETEPARDSKGEILGTREIINGREYYTLTTDENGQIVADLPEGLYKAVEIEASDIKYDIKDKEEYFGIGKGREGKIISAIGWANIIGESSSDYVNSGVKTQDGGYLIGGKFYSSSITVGEKTITNQGNYDGMLIKYNQAGVVEWLEDIGSTGSDSIENVLETGDGGFLVVGSFGTHDVTVKGRTLNNHGSTDGMIIKFGQDREVEWLDSIGGTSTDEITTATKTKDGGFIIGGRFHSSSITVGGRTINNSSSNGYNDGMIIKYSQEGVVQWAKKIGGSGHDTITSVVGTKDGGFIIGGSFDKTFVIDGVTLEESSSADTSQAGMVIKYNSSNNIEWTYREYTGTVNCVEEAPNGYLIAGQNSGRIMVNRVVYDGCLVKLDENGNWEWSTGLSRNSSTRTTSSVSYIKMIDNNEFFMSGYDASNTTYVLRRYSIDSNKVISEKRTTMSIKFLAGINSNTDYLLGGNTTSNYQLEDGSTLYNNGSTDGVIIKYSEEKVPEAISQYITNIGGNNADSIETICKTKDGGYIAGGNFKSNVISLNDNIQIENNNKASSTKTDDGMIIKYDHSGIIEWYKVIGAKENDSISKIIETSDGGYLILGNFASQTLDLGNGVVLNNIVSNNSESTSDGMLIKMNSNGTVEWAENYGTSSNDTFYDLAKAADGGYLIIGNVGPNMEVNGERIDEGSVLLKLNDIGKTEWAKGYYGTYNGQSSVSINNVISTKDGGYLVGGHYYANFIRFDGITIENKSDNGFQENDDDWFQYTDGIVIKYDSQGNVEWYKALEGSGHDYIYSIAETDDGKYLVGGHCSTVTNHSNTTSQSGIVLKLDSKGNQVWEKKIGRQVDINCIVPIKGEYFIVGGRFLDSTLNLGNNISLYRTGTNNSYSDVMVAKYNENGKAILADNVGGTAYEYITDITEWAEDLYLVTGYYNSSSITFENNKTSNKGNYDGLIWKVRENVGVIEQTNILINNTRKNYNITTDVNEINNIKGGIISGEDETPYENVKYGDSNTKSITMRPNTGYEIIKITVNGEEWQYEVNEDGSYTMPQFSNMSEDKHIVVTYAKKDNKIIINKENSVTKERLKNVKFKLDQVEERTVPVNEEIIGDLIGNGQTYTEADYDNEITGVLGGITNNSTYYFVEQDGKYVPTNSRTYQLANGGTGGKSGTAASYIPIDLSGLEGTYKIVVNANVSSRSNYDYGYATINQSTTIPSYSNSTGRFIYISGTSTSVTTPQNYESTVVLEGGQTYYLHLGYYKYSSSYSGTDQFVVNSIKLYKSKEVTYNFNNNEGKYESTNQGKAGTVSNSYIPINLEGYTGKYNLTVNANISSQSSYDYGYVTVTESTNRPSYSNSIGRFIYISGTQSAKDYTTVIEGGKTYYLHLGYYKNGSTDNGEDKFTVNSINITLNDSELYHTEIETNSQGQAITQIPFGKYQVTELNTPEGYWPLEEPVEIEFRSFDGAQHEFTIENEPKAKVTVHHYLKDSDGNYTETKLAEDEIMYGHIYDDYLTYPKIDLEKYELEKNEEGQTIAPENSNGKYTRDDIDVNYYYEEKMIPLVVHHYIEGTETPVPLADGTVALDEHRVGRENEEYTAEAIEDGILNENYELISTPKNAIGSYEFDEVEVTYYYGILQGNLVINKLSEDGVTKLKGAKFTIINVEDDNTSDARIYTTNDEGKIEVTLDVGTYNVTEIEPPEGHELSENSTQEITINKDNRNIEIEFINNKQRGDVITHHYIEGTTDNVPLNNGELAQDAVQRGIVGDDYTTSTIDNINEDYVLSIIPGNANGKFVLGTQEVIYYYKKIERTLIINKLSEDGVTPLQGAKFTITDVNEPQNIVDIGPMTSNGRYYFIESNGIYIPNNNGRHSTTANSYIRVDTTNAINNVTVKINAQVSSESGYDFGYITINESQTAPAYNNSIGRIAYVSGSGTARDYEQILQPGKVYYIHFGYRKDGSTNGGSDRFTINRIEFEGADSGEVYITNEEGKIETSLEIGTYTITEIVPPEGHELSENSTREVTLSRLTGDVEIDIINNRQRGTVITHHYIEGTTAKVPLSNGERANDERQRDLIGEPYTTNPIAEENLDENYQLVSTPTNANGTFTANTQEVYYYYKKLEKNLIITKVDEDGVTPIPGVTFNLVDIVNVGEIVNDGTYYFEKQGTKLVSNNKDVDNSIAHSYVPIDTTNWMNNGYLYINYSISSQYNGDYGYIALTESTEMPQMSDNTGRIATTSGVYNNYGTGTTLYPGRQYYLHFVYNKNADTSTNEDIFTINNFNVSPNSSYYTTDNEGKIYLTLKAGEYNLFENNAPKNYEIPTEPTILNVTKDMDTNITITNMKKRGTVTIHYYIEGTEIKVPSNDGGIVEDRVQTNKLEEQYVTEEANNVSEEYELVRTEGPITGIITEFPKEVFYYYKKKSDTLIIEKTDKDTGERMQDVKFKVEQEDERELPENLINQMRAINVEENNYNVTPYQYQMYYFYNDNGQYIPTNGKKYLRDFTNNTTAMSTISLTEKEAGRYYIKVNAEISSEENGDYGWVNYGINSLPTSSSGAFVYISGEVEATDYQSNEFEISETDTINISVGYSKNGSITSGNDEMIINSIKLVNIETNEEEDITDNLMSYYNYYFEKQNGKYVSNFTGVSNSGAYSNVQLTGMMSGKYIAYVNAASSTEEFGDYGYAALKENNPNYNSEQGRFMLLSGEKEAKNYYSPIFEYEEGGTSYHVVLGYLKNQTVNAGEDAVKINKVGLYRVIEDNTVETTDGGFVSTNQDIDNSISYGVIPLDLRNVQGKLNLNLDYEISSDGSDFGYVYISKDPLIVDTDNEEGRLLYISGIRDPKHLQAVINGGSMYYLHIGYKKDGQNRLGDDTFKVSNVNITLNSEDYYSNEELITNEEGKIEITVPYGKYKITEIETPEKYKEIEPQEFEFNVNGEHKVSIENEKKDGEVIVHHYIEGTTTKVPNKNNGVVEDVIINGKVDEQYNTLETLEKAEYYELVEEPVNKDGIITEDTIEVNYYYRLKEYNYKVNYLEKETNQVLSTQKEQTGITFGTIIDSNAEKIEINGYNFDSVDKNNLIIGTNENVINLYYTKKNDLSYTIHYKEQGSETTLAEDKVEINKTFGDKFTETAIDIAGYNKVDPTSTEITVIDGVNEYTFYYTKKTDLSYTIHYKEQGTEKELAPDKVVTGKAFEEKVTETAIDIEGYNKVDPTSTEITVLDGVNEYTFYYNRAKFNYTVEYYYDNVIDDSKTEQIESLYHEEITSYTDKVKEGYKLDKVEGVPLTISENEDENIIKVYYVIAPSQTKTIQYIVNYYKDNVLQEADTQYQTQEVNLLSDEELVVDKSSINTTNKYEDYTFVETNPTQIPDTIKNGGVIDVYYTRNKYPYSIEYYYNNIIDAKATESGQGYKGDIIDTYTNKNKDGYEFESVDGLPLVISSTEDNIIKVYYLPIRKITINHIDKNTNEIIKAEERTAKEGYKVKTSAEDFEGYVLLEKPEIEEYTYSENEQIVNYYYAKVSSGVIEKHIDIVSGKPIVKDTLHEGYTGKAYTTQIKNIDNYEHATNKQYYKMLLEKNPNLLSEAGVSTLEEYLESKGINENLDYIPANSKGNMTEDLIEVRYYYVPKAKLIVKYVDINTGKEITEEIDGSMVSTTIEKDGVVDEAYSTTQKEFDDYIVISNKIYYKNYFKNHPDELKEDSIDEYMTKNNINPDAPYTPSNSKGTMLLINNPDGTYSNETIVTYYYGKEREVVVKYYDHNTNEEISEEIVKIGPDGEPYSVEDTKKEIENYTLLEEPDNPTGIYQENNETRKYYYAKNTQVVVKYVDEATGEELAITKTIDGYVGKVYITEKEDIDGYNYVSSTDNTSGKMTEDTLEVLYYYTKPVEKTYTSYEINYIDADTGETISTPKVVTDQEVGTTIYAKALIIDIDNYTYEDSDKDSIVLKDGASNTITLYYKKNIEKTEPEVKPKEEPKTEPKVEPKVETTPKKESTPKVVPQTNNADKVVVKNTHKSNLVTTILGISFIFVGCAIIVESKFKHKAEK